MVELFTTNQERHSELRMKALFKIRVNWKCKENGKKQMRKQQEIALMVKDGFIAAALYIGSAYIISLIILQRMLGQADKDIIFALCMHVVNLFRGVT